LEGILGVGPSRRRALLQHFGSLREIREADVETIAAVDGISGTLATAIHEHLHTL
jgi:excinuclease ABC subunit C